MKLLNTISQDLPSSAPTGRDFWFLCRRRRAEAQNGLTEVSGTHLKNRFRHANHANNSSEDTVMELHDVEHFDSWENDVLYYPSSLRESTNLCLHCYLNSKLGAIIYSTTALVTAWSHQSEVY